MESKENYDIKELQKIQLSILKDIDKFCKENDIKYYITMGTLLGAVRHKGFIPWDDDIDIDLMRDDYEKFLKLFPKNDKKYFLQNYKTDKNYFNINYSKIRLNGTLRMGKGMEKIQQHHGISIDVFPVDVVSKSKDDRVKQRRKIRFISNLAVAKSGYKSPKNSVLQNIVLSIIHIILKPIPMSFLGKKIERVKKAYNGSNSNLVSRTHYIKGGENVVFDKLVYGTPTKLIFDGDEFNAPQKYIEFLEQVYGDYKKLPPENQRFNYNHCVDKVDLGKYKENKENGKID